MWLPIKPAPPVTINFDMHSRPFNKVMESRNIEGLVDPLTRRLGDLCDFLLRSELVNHAVVEFGRRDQFAPDSCVQLLRYFPSLALGNMPRLHGKPQVCEGGFSFTDGRKLVREDLIHSAEVPKTQRELGGNE